MDGPGLLQNEISCLKLIAVVVVMENGLCQPAVAADRQEIDAEAFLPQDVGVGVSMLVQIAHDREKSSLVPVKAAPAMEAHIRLPVLLPRSDGKECAGDGGGRLKVGKKLELLRVQGFEISGELFPNLNLHVLHPPS